MSAAGSLTASQRDWLRVRSHLGEHRYGLALDFPARTPWLARLLSELDELVLNAGGRLYLAKDSRIPAELIPRMYPRYEEFRALRARLDPAGVFSSDLSRRLQL